MRKFLYLPLFFLSIAVFFSSQVYAKTHAGDSDLEQSPDARFIPAIVMLDEGDDVDETLELLKNQGITVLRQRGRFFLTFIPANFDTSTMRKKRGVRKIEFSRRYNNPTMANARNFRDAFLINEGFDLPQAYDGKGVVVGVCDIGMDTRHVNFLSADGSECRIRRVVHYQEEQGLRSVYSTPQEIYDWQTDNSDEWHATHVTGIAAGAYKDYRSLAPGADIVFTASQLSDVGLLAGVEDIIEYAKEVGKPAVINLSMGNNLGPHDGTSLFTQYLDLCAEEAIICISAGNDGDWGANTGVSLTHRFTESNPSVSVMTTNWNGLYTYGEAQVWCADKRPVGFTLNLYGEDKRKDVIPLRKLDFSETTEQTFRISADPSDPDYDETFASIYNEGYFLVSAGVSPLNNRFNITVDMELVTDKYSGSNAWAEFWPGITLEGEPGQYVEVFGGGGIFLRTVTGNTAPGNYMSISDLATGHKTISVGMTTNSSVETYLDGSEKVRDWKEGYVNPLSSYGTLSDGRKMPMTCAPGGVVVSSISNKFLSSHPEEVGKTHHFENVDNENYYWAYNTGTSMSCPYVVSAIATWLQADPSLTAEDAMDIINKTNFSDYPEPENPRNGQGWFSPYAGLQAVVKNVGSVDVSSPSHLQGVDMKYGSGMLFLANFSGMECKMTVYSIAGNMVLTHHVPEGNSSCELSSLNQGVYMVAVENPAGLRKVMKIFVN